MILMKLVIYAQKVIIEKLWWGSETDEIIEELCESFLQKYQGLHESMRKRSNSILEVTL